MSAQPLSNLTLPQTVIERWIVPSPEAMTAIAQGVANSVSAGDTLLLAGDLGAGKTHFARGVIQSLLAKVGLTEDVPSPSFTLVQIYEAGDLEIWHSDLYRLTSVDEVFELGLEAAFGSALCLIEWPDRLEELAPADAVTLQFEMAPEDPDKRIVSVLGNPNSPLAAALKGVGSDV
jgi:tRNA threonylcarbamoyladenosine biosynthesis protein TsaE